jgi:hypothetical protein
MFFPGFRSFGLTLTRQEVVSALFPDISWVFGRLWLVRACSNCLRRAFNENKMWFVKVTHSLSRLQGMLVSKTFQLNRLKVMQLFNQNPPRQGLTPHLWWLQLIRTFILKTLRFYLWGESRRVGVLFSVCVTTRCHDVGAASGTNRSRFLPCPDPFSELTFDFWKITTV